MAHISGIDLSEISLPLGAPVIMAGKDEPPMPDLAERPLINPPAENTRIVCLQVFGENDQARPVQVVVVIYCACSLLAASVSSVLIVMEPVPPKKHVISTMDFGSGSI